MKIYIKNMVCNRCKMVVKSELIKFGLHPTCIELGEVEIIGLCKNSCLSAIISMNIMQELLFKHIVIVFYAIFMSR